MPMVSLDAVCGVLARIAPLKLAEDWDNVGLLVGDRGASVARLMTCLTITPDVVEEAIADSAHLIVSHHPLPFKPLTKITTDSVTGSMLWRLAGARIGIYSAHTAFDSAVEGINQMWADAIGLTSTEPLVIDAASDRQSGRAGKLASSMSLTELACTAASFGGGAVPRIVGDPESEISHVALACGSGGSFLAAAKRRGCGVLVTGEATFHTCLEARSSGIGLVLLGHFASERFAMERLAEKLGREFPEMVVWSSRRECDPIVGIS